MDIYDREYLKEFLIALFGQQAKSWHPNDELFDLTYELISESGECDEAMKLVPEPLGPGKNTLKWLSKEARSKFLKMLAENKEHYTLCVKAAAYRMAQRFHMAALGV
ncbi:hypothetical protein [Marinobacter salarius]|jgi:hypothetical protein|uniref:hypothetical protein n=1 Tax=Marinobacter salarius TaxID=1420917 RepID=UPI0018F2171A|nr:hypothetical protein [Marinobacter salarius]MBJ7299895.1 hypothetical protein [Marinobacter salarius]HIO29310.1 hypothetical protein [Marinobacter salarius]HIO99464.1 hypothetical protein [Marinobacter salarius]